MNRYVLILLTTCCTLALGARTSVAGGDDKNPGKKEKTFTVTKGGTLSVSVGVGDIKIKTWDKNEVYVGVTGEDEEEDELANVKLRQHDNSISVTYDPEWGPSGGIEFEISIPSQFNVTMETSGGDIRIAGNLIGTLKGETSGGNISVGGVKGNVELSTSGGDIKTDDVDGDLTLNTSGGDIKVGKITGVTDVHTSGGEITIESCAKSATAETAGGNVTIGDIKGDAVVTTAGGDISLEKVSGGAKLQTAGGNIELHGANGRVTARTAGGDINLDHIVGSVEAKTAAGNLDVELTPSGTGKSTLTSTVGDATLRIAGDAKASVTARVRLQGWWRGSSEDEYIYSDFKETSYDRSSRDREIRATYTLGGGGGQEISIGVTMGNIHIVNPGKSTNSEKHKSKEK